jgi:hypothetical protein
VTPDILTHLLGRVTLSSSLQNGKLRFIPHNCLRLQDLGVEDILRARSIVATASQARQELPLVTTPVPLPAAAGSLVIPQILTGHLLTICAHRQSAG